MPGPQGGKRTLSLSVVKRQRAVLLPPTRLAALPPLLGARAAVLLQALDEFRRDTLEGDAVLGDLDRADSGGEQDEHDDQPERQAGAANGGEDAEHLRRLPALRATLCQGEHDAK